MKLKVSCIYYFILILIFGCSQKNQNTESVNGSPNTSQTNTKDDVIVFDENKICNKWLDDIDKEILSAICKQFSTSTIEVPDEYDLYFELKNRGTLGHYSLFFEGESGIRELGKLIVFIKKEPNNWTFFDPSEKNLSITLKDSIFKLNEYLFVGQNIDKILSKFKGNIVKTNYGYKLESDCEILDMKVDSFKNVSEINLFTKKVNHLLRP